MVDGSPEVRAGMLLVATPQLLDPNFVDSVVLILDVDEGGALGVVLNRPSGVPVAEVLETWGEIASEPEVLFRGGPVSTEGALGVALLRDGDDVPVGFREVDGLLGLVDLDTPVELVTGSLAGMRIFAGYAGWGADQLAEEIDGGQLVRRPGRGRGRVPARPGGALARRAAAPARRAGLALDASCGSGTQLSGAFHVELVG